MDMNTYSGPTYDDEYTAHIDGATADAHNELIDEIDAATQAVAAQMPFPVKVDADMGGTFAFHIDLGTPRDTDDPDDPHETAGMDPNDPDLSWWYSGDGGQHNVKSPYGYGADPQTVAKWIVHQAARPDLAESFAPGPMARARAARAIIEHPADSATIVAPPTAGLER